MHVHILTKIILKISLFIYWGYVLIGFKLIETMQIIFQKKNNYFIYLYIYFFNDLIKKDPQLKFFINSVQAIFDIPLCLYTMGFLCIGRTFW